ncbi:MAG: zinc ribbon domain-containing protein [Firmicutes bacterium]|nr:zinc ribbon domain-containing protein [Bacillota bacterium]
MPTYEYRCKNCSHRFEVLIPSAEKNQVVCPECKSSQLQEIYGFNTARSSRSNACSTCPTSTAGMG